MSKTLVTPEISKFILENYLKMSRGAIARNFGFSKEVCNLFYKKNNLNLSYDIVQGFKIKLGQTTFTADEDLFIKENYLTMPVKIIGNHLGRSYCGITGRLKSMNLVIPEEIIQQRKNDSVYKLGQIPFNKGKKITEFMSPEAIERSKVHRYKKGNIPKNALADGTEVLRPDKRSGKVYTLIKVPGISKLKAKQIHVWETHHKKKLPPGHNIVFADGNTQNFEPENLLCVSNAELMARNTIHQYPEDLQKIIKLKNKLNKVIHENTKRKQD